MKPESTQQSGRLFSNPVGTTSLALALGVAGVVTNILDRPLMAKWPDLEANLWLRVLAVSGIFLVAALILHFLFRAIVWSLVGFYLHRFSPEKIAGYLPSLIAGTLPTVDQPALTSGALDEAARRIATKVFLRLVRRAIPGTVREFQDLQSELRDKASVDDVVRLVRAMSERCMRDAPLVPGAPQEMIYSDPVHGTIEFPARFRWLLTHPALQRLNEVRQLPFAFPKYPGGTHTRFSHSVGVAHLARTIVQRVMDRDVLYTPSGIRSIELDQGSRARLADLATVCGLVHDAGHGPLGHTLDRFFQTRIFEGEGSSDADKELLPRVLSRLAEPIAAVNGITVDEVTHVLFGERLEGWVLFLSQLLSSMLDVDRIDYLQRDAHFTGQLEGLLNLEALISSVRPFQKDNQIFLTFDMSFLGDIEQFVYARDAMYLRCYEQRSKVVSEALSSRAVDGLFKLAPELRDNLDHFAVLTDAQLVELVNALPNNDEGGPKDLLTRVLRSDALDFSEVDSMPFVDTFMKGQLHGLLAEFEYPSDVLIEKIAQIEKKIAKEGGVGPSDVVLVLPDPKANEERSAILDILILKKDGSGFRAVPLLSEGEDTSPSEVLQRLKFVSKDLVDAVASRDVVDATKLQEITEAAATGVSLIGIMRRARFRLRLFLHNSKLAESEAAVKNAFRALGSATKTDARSSG